MTKSGEPATGWKTGPYHSDVRIAIVGTSGSGKSTLSLRISESLDIPHVELDALWHRPGWTTVTEDELRAQVREALTADGWVADGNYSAVRELVWGSADIIIWLDYPRWFVMQRMVRRSLRRVSMRVELWHGNREELRRLLAFDPEENIVLWAWTTHAMNREQYDAAFSDPRWADKRRVRLRSAREARRFVAGLSSLTGP